MGIKYKLIDKNRDETAIILYFYLKNTRKKCGTGLIIKPEAWDFKTEQPISDKETIKSIYERQLNPELNLSRISNKLNEAREIVEHYEIDKDRNKQPIVWEEIKSLLTKHFKPEIIIKETPKLESNICRFTRKWIEEVKSNHYQYGNRDYAASTLQTYSEFANYLEKYENSNRKKLTFDGLNSTTYNDLKNYSIKYGLNPNSIGKLFKNIKSISNIAFEKGVHTNLFHRSRSFVVTKEKVKSIYLTHTELSKLDSLTDLTETQTLYRDLFLIGCSTMQRYSDYSRISKEDISFTNDGPFWILEQRKTEEPLKIELSEKCNSLLEKYDYNIPKTSSQTMNEYIKILGKKAGITSVIIGTNKENGIKTTSRTDKCDLITSHTCRRTGATLSYLDGTPLLDICKITGHKSISSLEAYLQPTDEDRNLRKEAMKQLRIENNIIQLNRAI